jgi:hypothetical protein
MPIEVRNVGGVPHGALLSNALTSLRTCCYLLRCQKMGYLKVWLVRVGFPLCVVAKTERAGKAAQRVHSQEACNVEKAI